MQRVLDLSDAGSTPAAIASAIPAPLATVYAILRAHRPDRPRAPRTRTAVLPVKIRGLLDAGHKPARVAELVGCSRAYVYRVQSDAV